MNLNIDRFLNVYGVGGIALISVLVFAAFVLAGAGGVKSLETLQGVEAVVYKSPSCGCCGAWAQYAEAKGLDVEVKEVSNLNRVKQKYGVPEGRQACHTTVLKESGYAVEGHVPVEVIEKLLKQRPDVQGIGLPGMPQGSPGMPGPKQGDWKIYSFSKNGVSEFMTV